MDPFWNADSQAFLASANPSRRPPLLPPNAYRYRAAVFTPAAGNRKLISTIGDASVAEQEKRPGALWMNTPVGRVSRQRNALSDGRRGNRKRCDRQAQSDAPNPLTATVALLIRARLSPQRHSCLSVPSVHHTSIKPMRSVTGASARQTATISRRVRRRRHPAFHADQVGARSHRTSCRRCMRLRRLRMRDRIGP